MEQLHYIQMQILRDLLFAKGKKFSELNNLDLETNQHNFHLQKLIGSGYVEKVGKEYKLTNEGKEYANTMDTNSNKIVKQAKLSALCVCFRGSGENREVLIYTRLKQPFYGSQGFFSGKIQYGETVQEAAVRELKEETGMIGNPKIKGLRHFRVYTKADQKLVEDKFMFFVVFENPKGKLHPHEEGKYEWVKVSEMKEYVTKSFPDFFESFDLVATSKEFFFVETDEVTGQF